MRSKANQELSLEALWQYRRSPEDRYTAGEIAAITGIPRKQVEAILIKCVLQLRDELRVDETKIVKALCYGEPES